MLELDLFEENLEDLKVEKARLKQILDKGLPSNSDNLQTYQDCYNKYNNNPGVVGYKGNTISTIVRYVNICYCPGNINTIRFSFYVYGIQYTMHKYLILFMVAQETQKHYRIFILHL